MPDSARIKAATWLGVARAASGKTTGKGSSSGKGKGKGTKSRTNKRRTEDFNIDNIVVPFTTPTAPPAVSKLAVKEIVLPVVEVVGEDSDAEAEGEAEANGGESSDDEAVDDATFYRRHAEYEYKERARYMGLPPATNWRAESVVLPSSFVEYGRDADSMKEGARQYLLELEAAKAGDLVDSLSSDDEFDSDDSDEFFNKALSDDDNELLGLGSPRKRRRTRAAKAHLLNARQRRRWERLKFEFLEYARMQPKQVESLFGLWAAVPERTSLVSRPSYNYVLRNSNVVPRHPPVPGVTDGGSESPAGPRAPVVAAYSTPEPATSLLLRRLPVLPEP